MVIGVTGANGFIGSSIIAGLNGLGHQLIGLVRPQSAIDPSTANLCEVRRTCYRDPAALRQALESVEVLCHCCGHLGGWSVQDSLLTAANVEVTRFVAQGAIEVGVRQMVQRVRAFQGRS